MDGARTSAIAVLFGAYEQDGHFLFSIPEIVFVVSITIYFIVKASGRPRSSTTPGMAESTTAR